MTTNPSLETAEIDALIAFTRNRELMVKTFIANPRMLMQALTVLADEVVCLRAALAAAPPSAGEGWRPTHRHVKRGGLYRVIGGAKLQTAEPQSDDAYLIVYQDERGLLWARPQPEFADGRFERLTPDVPSPPVDKAK